MVKDNNQLNNCFSQLKDFPLVLLLVLAWTIAPPFPVRAEPLPPRAEIPLLPAGSTLQQVILYDSTVVSQEQVDAAARPYIGLNVTLEDLQELQKQLNALYIQAGYTTTIVQFLARDNQRLEAGEGIVVYRALEGNLEKIETDGLSHLRESYLRERLLPYAESPLNINQLEEGLLLLQEDSLIDTI